MARSSWALIQECVRRAIAKALEVDVSLGGACEWYGTHLANRFQDPEAPWMVELRLSPIVGKGRDEKRMQANPDGAVVTYGGYRLFNVGVNVIGMDQEPGYDSTAEAGGKLRLRMRRPDVTDILKEQQVALVSIGPTWNTDFPGDNNRLMSASQTEIRFATVEFEEDEESENTWVQTVEGSGHFEPNDVDVPIQVETPDPPP